MQTSGFTSTPATLLLVMTLTTLSLVASITSTKHHLPLRPTPHLYPYLQLHRLLTHQLAYTSSIDLLFSAVLLYHLRVLERLFGTRKFASLVLVSVLCNAVLTPALVALVVRPLSLGWWDYVPAGATGTVFALVALWGSEVPRLWRWEIVLSPAGGGVATQDLAAAASPVRSSGTSRAQQQQQPPPPPPATSTVTTLTLSDKATTYLLALQLALTQFPYTILPAMVGYLIGSAWAGDFLPGHMSSWRVPRWVVGEAPLLGGNKRRPGGRGGGDGGVGAGGVERERYESLRRRLEEEGGRGGDGDGMRQAAHAHGQTAGVAEPSTATGRRPMGTQIADYFRGVF